MYSLRHVLLVLCFCLSPLVSQAAPAGAPAPPERLLHVPKLATAPVIDGVIGEHEWDGACAVTGFANPMGTIVPAFQQVVLYLGYDEQNLYLRMYSPKPKDMVLQASTKEHDNEGGMIFEDHVEIQISNHGRENVFRRGDGFYKLCVNPLNTLSDLWYFCPTSGSEATWESGAVVKSGVHDDRWDMEMAIPLKSILPAGATPDNAPFILQFVRADTCGGIYYVGVAAGDWQSWPAFPEIVLDPQTPAVQLTSVGDLPDGNLDAHVRVNGNPGTAVTVNVSVLNKAGTALYAQEKTVAAGTDAAFTQPGLALDDTGNTFLLTGAVNGTPIYCQTNPILKMTQHYKDFYLTPWLQTKPKAGDYHFNVAYWPYYDKINLGVDLDFLGVPPALLAAPQYDVTLYDAAGKSVAKQGGKLQAKEGTMVMEVPNLPAGDYTLKLRLLDANGGVIDDKKEVKLTRVIYPWEHNKLGTAPVVIPPYTPIKVQGQTLSVWGRDLEIGPGGLPGKITDQGEDILAAPMRLEAVVDGKPQVWTPADVKVTAAAPNRVELQGTAQVAGAPVTVNATLEYDGWYQLAVKLGTSAATVDSLDLVIPMSDQADTVDMMRGWYIANNSRYAGAIPPGKGVVWESSQLSPAGDWGSFVPQMFIGNGDRGLWVLAPNQEDWVLDAKRSTVSLERVDGKPQLRIRFIAGTTALDTPRLLDLILLPEPVKPLPKDWRAIAWAYPTAHYIHDEDGYRYYGAQVDGYTLPTDDDYLKLAGVINGKPWYAGDKEAAARPGPGVKQRANDFPNEPIALYGSGWKTGMNDDFHTFGGEWLQNSQWVAKPEAEYDGSWNATKTVHWTTALQNTVVWVNWTQSLVDQYVWYYEKHLRLAGFNGTWWDDGGLGTSTDWDARRGKFVNQWWFQARRDLCKRLNVIGTQLGRPPLWLTNQHADFSWSQIGWHIEEIFYGSDTKVKGYFGVLTPDQFRAVTGTRGGIIPRLVPRSEADLTPDEQAHFWRTAYGMCALHDMGAYLVGNNGGGDENSDVANGNINAAENRIRMMLALVGAYQPGAEFIPYWRSQALVHMQPKPLANAVANNLPVLLISIYRSPGHDKALLVMANPSGKRMEFITSWLYTIEDSLLGHPAQQMVDAFTMEQLPNGGSWGIDPYDFRFVFVE
jgi:hypothetical protein